METAIGLMTIVCQVRSDLRIAIAVLCQNSKVLNYHNAHYLYKVGTTGICPWSNNDDYVIAEVDVSVYAAVNVYYVNALLL